MKLILLFGLIVAVSCSDDDVIPRNHRVTHRAWFDIKIAKEYVGRIEIGLFGKVEPYTVNNFVNLVNKPKGKGYKGSKFYEIQKNEFISGGDWIGNNGKQGRNYVEMFDDDERYMIQHYGAGWISMNGFAEEPKSSLFLITLNRLESFNGNRIVIGKIIEGMSVVRRMAKVPVNQKNVPVRDIVISDCGAELADPPFLVEANDAID